MAEDADAHERLETELSMLQTMYPDQIEWLAKRREVRYIEEGSYTSLTLRLPEQYLVSALPEVVTASTRKHDLRDELQNNVKHCDIGIEVLDVILDAFRELVDKMDSVDAITANETASELEQESSKTVVVWLHHLLNTNKRKQALSPPVAGVSGVTKPGYPGVLVYSGPASAVAEHVNELKGLNWQAFQVRLEVDEEWSFKHGPGVTEAASMAEIVAEIDPSNKQDFLQALHIA